jgi:bile acid:Na+ symporter, BASS family
VAIEGALVDLSETWLLPGALATIMFAIGLELRPAAFLGLAVQRKPLIAGIAGMALIVPLVGTFIAWKLAPTPAVAVGLILLATCPVGVLAPLVTDLCKGSVALSIAMTVIVSGLYILLGPLIAHHAVEAAFGRSQPIQAPTGSLFIKVALVTVAPVSLGLLVARLRPQLAKRGGSNKSVMSVVLIAVFGLIVMRQWQTLVHAMWAITGLVVLMNLVNLLIAGLVTRIAGLKGADASSIIVCHVMRQEGTAIFIAVSVLGAPQIALPLIINTFVGIALCAVLLPPLRAQRQHCADGA